MAAPRKRSAAKSKAAPRSARPHKSAKKVSSSARPKGRGLPRAKSHPKPGARAKGAAAPKRPPAKAAKPAAKPAVAKTVAKPAAKPAGGRKGSQPAEVKPIGMLPPEAVARATHRLHPKPVKIASPARPEAVRSIRPAAPGEGAQRVTDQDLKEFEDRLLEERRKILKEMGHLETTVLKVNQRDSSGDLSGYSFHMADAGTDAMEREKAFQFASAEGRFLMEIDSALQRLYRGEYGMCESCGQPISRARLEAMPYARLCVACKEKEERAQRGAV